MAKNNIIKWRLCPLIMKYVLSQLNRDAEIKTGNSQYRLCHMVGLIKRTCLELLDGKFDIENTHTYVPAVNILGALLEGYYYIRRTLESEVTDEFAAIKRRLRCSKREAVLEFRIKCMVRKILSSNIRDIEEKAVKKTVKAIQEYVKTDNPFFTISHSVQKGSFDITGSSTTTHHINSSCDNRSVPTDSIFTDALQINWSAVTARRLQQIQVDHGRVLKDDKLEERGKEEIGKKDGETEKEPDGKRDTEVDTREEEEQLKGEENDEGGKAMMKYDNVEEETGDEEREKETMENPKDEEEEETGKETAAQRNNRQSTKRSKFCVLV